MSVVHLILLIFALCCFAFDAFWQSAPGPGAPTRVTCIGLAFLAASLISW